MPELPEVEVTRRILAPRVVGRTISRLRCTAPSYFFLTAPRVLQKNLTGQEILKLDRQGKYLLMNLRDGQRLLLHLGMTGQLFMADSQSPRLLTLASHTDGASDFKPDAHTHLQFEFKDNKPGLYFRDVRKFGKVRLLAAGQSDLRLDKLGPDALLVKGTHLFNASRKRQLPVKSFLLDQKVLAGVGNIYADEALFRSRILPTKAAASVARNKYEELAREVQAVLKRSIETGGSSISDFVAPDGSDGGFQNERLVYAREGEPCSACKSKILRIVVGQRSTHYCARCQS